MRRASFIDDLDAFYLTKGEPLPGQPTWATLAEILAAAMVYE